MLDTTKFRSQKITAKGEERAYVDFRELKTLWFNTGTQCNLECANCYIESSPKNDRLAYLEEKDVAPYLNEIIDKNFETKFIAFTGGEPFLNPNMIAILNLVLSKGFTAQILTNGYKVISRVENELLELQKKYGDRLKLRISLDHYTAEIHEKERGPKTFTGALKSMKWLWDHGIQVSVAGRSLTGEDIDATKAGYQKVLLENDINIELNNDRIVIFPEMDPVKDVPEITTACWDILSKKPENQMCSTERMIVKRKGAEETVVLPCTLLAYDEQFELGNTLEQSAQRVFLNHPFCAEFCVLGGASCSSTN